MSKILISQSLVRPASCGSRNMAASFIVIWDFDWTLINENSDTYVINQLGGSPATARMNSFGEDVLWTERMSLMCQHLTRDLGVTRQDIVDCMRTIPIFRENLELVRALGRRADVVQVIVSDANSLFIEAFLTENKLEECFDAVYTNPVAFQKCSSDGRSVLHVNPFVDERRPHGCETCTKTPNMCKGQIVDLLRARYSPQSSLSIETVDQKVYYLGDGRGDFCGVSRLSGNDTVLCRHGFSLSELLSEHPPKANDVVIWKDGKDIFQAFAKRGLLSECRSGVGKK